MTSTVREPDRSYLVDDAVPETAAGLSRLDGLPGPLAPSPRAAQGIAPTWNCLEHVPGSIGSWVGECVRFGGRTRRHHAAKAAYDAIWAGHGTAERGDEPSFPSVVPIEVGPPLRQPRSVSAATGGPGAS